MREHPCPLCRIDVNPWVMRPDHMIYYPHIICKYCYEKQFTPDEREWVIHQQESFAPIEWTIIEMKTGSGFMEVLNYTNQLREYLYQALAVPAELLEQPFYGESSLRYSYRAAMQLYEMRKLREKYLLDFFGDNTPREDK